MIDQEMSFANDWGLGLEGFTPCVVRTSSTNYITTKEETGYSEEVELKMISFV